MTEYVVVRREDEKQLILFRTQRAQSGFWSIFVPAGSKQPRVYRTLQGAIDRASYEYASASLQRSIWFSRLTFLVYVWEDGKLGMPIGEIG